METENRNALWKLQIVPSASCFPRKPLAGSAARSRALRHSPVPLASGANQRREVTNLSRSTGAGKQSGS